MTTSKITKTFISDRQKYAHRVLKVVDVYYAGNLSANSCFDNAMQRQKGSGKHGLPKAIAVSGWIIDTSQAKLGGAVVIPHWWNYDAHSDLYFDHTDLRENHNIHYDYVLDLDLSLYFFAHQADLAGPIAKSLIRRQGAWREAALQDDGVATRALSDLRTERLFHRKAAQARASARKSA